MDSTLKNYIISHSQYNNQQIVLPATFWSSRPPCFGQSVAVEVKQRSFRFETSYYV